MMQVKYESGLVYIYILVCLIINYITFEYPFGISWMRHPEGLLWHDLGAGLGRRVSKETSTTAQVPSICCLQYLT